MRSALLASLLIGCAAATPVKVENAPTPAAPPRAIALVGRHAPKNTVTGPKGKVFAASDEDLFVYSASDPSSGERFPFHGAVVAPPSGRLYRRDGKSFSEIDETGADQRSVRFDRDVYNVSFSSSGALIGVALLEGELMQQTPTLFVVLRAADLKEIARTNGMVENVITYSRDDAYFTVGTRVYDAKTGKVVFEHVGLPRSAIDFEGTRMFWLFEDVLGVVDLTKGTSTDRWLPCTGKSRESKAFPEQHRFETVCDKDTLVTDVAVTPPTFTHVATKNDAPTPAPAKAAPIALGLAKDALLPDEGLALRDGALTFTPRNTTTTSTLTRLRPPRLAPISVHLAIINGDVAVEGADGTPTSKFHFGYYSPDPNGLAVVGDTAVLWRYSFATRPPDAPFTCDFKGNCEQRLGSDRLFLGYWDGELFGNTINQPTTAIVRENVVTKAKVTTPIPRGFNGYDVLERSEDARFFILMNTESPGTHARLTRIENASNRVTGTLEINDASYAKSALLGIAGDRIVLAPDYGMGAYVTLLDAQTFAEKEHWLFGKDATLHVREDGTYETTGDAKALEKGIACLDGTHLVAPSRCHAK